MTEAEWLACGDPELILSELGAEASIRKLRLFMCACCRRVWDLIREPHCRVAVEVTERWLEAEATEEEFAIAAEAVEWAWSRQRSGGNVLAEEAAMYPTVENPLEGAISCVGCILDYYRYRSSDQQLPTRRDIDEAAVHTQLQRDIFGNPFRPVAFSPSWRTDTALSLARQMYESRDFGAMPILADALQDAGCENADILNHCRDSGPHVRGCWVVDLILSKDR